MSKAPRRPFKETLRDPQFIALAMVFVVSAASVFFFGEELAPFLIAFVFAYFLDGGIKRLTRKGVGRGVALALVFTAFIAVYVAVLVGPLQRVAQRAIGLAAVVNLQTGDLAHLVESLLHPVLTLIPQQQQSQLVEYAIVQITAGLDYLLKETVASLPQFTGWMIYLFIIPFLVFFFLKDKDRLIRGFVRLLPRNHELVVEIWDDMEEKMGNYIRGKIWEILIVGVVTWIALVMLDYRSPVVMGVVSGVSVLIPYVGAIGAAVPIFIVGYLQWGLTWDLGWVMIAYTVIQVLDGNVLVPLMFSEAVKLHPVWILLAVVIFGSIWGLWGLFFAIPLATLAKSLFTTILDFRERSVDA